MDVSTTGVWLGELRHRLTEQYGSGHGDQVFARYAEAFPQTYRDAVSTGQATADISALEGALASDGTIGQASPPVGAGSGRNEAGSLVVGAETGAARRRVPRAGEHGPSDRRPPALRHQASRVRTGPDRGVPAHPTGLRVVGRRDAPRTPRERVHRDLERRGRGRRVQPAAPRGAPELARGGHPAWHLRLPSSGRSPVQPGARGAHTRQSPRGCATARGTVHCPLRSVTPR